MDKHFDRIDDLAEEVIAPMLEDWDGPTALEVANALKDRGLVEWVRVYEGNRIVDNDTGFRCHADTDEIWAVYAELDGARA